MVDGKGLSHDETFSSFDDPFRMDPIRFYPDSKRPGSSSDDARSSAMTCDSSRVTLRGCICIGVLFFINLLNYMDRYTVSGVLTQIQAYFSINDAMAGLLQTVFIVFYMVFAPLCGFLGDRYNRKWIMTVGVAVWVLAVFASSFVPSELFWLFMLLRGIVGVGEASYAVIAPTMIADLFASVLRSRVLMFFYFAIPFGSGLGYIVGSTLASALGGWQWGIRLTPILGVICLLLIIFLVDEPKRGEAEKASGAHAATDMLATSYWEDIKALCKIPTFLAATLGYTAVVFVVGTLSWWAPTEIQHAKAMHIGLNSTDDLSHADRDRISFMFGAVTVAGGILGVALGSAIAQIWSQGKWCCSALKTPRANALVCGLGSLFGVPFLFLALHLIQSNLTASWVLMLLSVWTLSLNWATNVDLLLDVVTPRRRGVASAWQILISHLFGDASGPYITGLISDLIRGSADTPKAHFNSLLKAFYLPIVLLVVSAILFFIAAYFFMRDRRKFQQQMGYSTSDTDVSFNGKGVVIVKEYEKDLGVVNDAFTSHTQL